MRHATTQTTQVFSVFGGGYVPETHGAEPASKPREEGFLGKLFVTLVAALFVATTAGAIAASAKNRAATPELWKQTPAFVLGLPGGYGVAEALF